MSVENTEAHVADHNKVVILFLAFAFFAIAAMNLAVGTVPVMIA